jgi:hypothetical protein
MAIAIIYENSLATTYYQLTVSKSLGYASQASKSAQNLCWRSGRVVDGAALEMLCRATYRGFESHLLRN